jgi:protein-disulfide isomerase
MNWRAALIATITFVSITGCSLTPASQAVPADAPLLSNQTPNPRGLGDPNAPVKISEYTDYQ